VTLDQQLPVGVWLFPEAPAAELVQTFEAAEELGLDEVWIGDEGPAHQDPFAVLAAAAVRTSRITLGIAVTNPYLRHPAVTASAMATVAELSGGRAILGLGAGGGVALDPVGITRAKPLTRTRDALRIARAVVDGRATEGYLPPDGAASRGPLPVYIGARGEAFNRYASAEADGAFLGGIPFADLGTAVGWTRSVRPVPIALYPSVIFDGEDLEWARPRFIFAFLDTPASTRRHAGLSEDEVRRAVESFEQGDDAPARDLITDEVLANLAVIGDPGVIAARLAELVRTHRPASIGVCLRTPRPLQARLGDVQQVFARMSKLLPSEDTA
jgi:5,10-methylenetetrahydromethanopterin reductase